MKDNFSLQARQYAAFRPEYPGDLFDFLMSLVPDKAAAWDAGTGNGQVAVKLADFFETVYATDISPQQLANAPARSNIIYKVEPAEHTSAPDNIFNLITVAQAIHWFNFDLFYAEVYRTLKADDLLAVIGYGLLQIDEKTDAVIQKLYTTILGRFWDQERKYIDALYKTIPFPMAEIPTPAFAITCTWTFEQLTGYLNTWSAVQHYIKLNKLNPLSLVQQELKAGWGQDLIKKVTFPVVLRVGRKLPAAG